MYFRPDTKYDNNDFQPNFFSIESNLNSIEMKKFIVFLTLILIISCGDEKSIEKNVVTSDIDLFWNVYDKVIQESDSLKQLELIQREYIDKGSIGLEKIIEVRNYSAAQYLQLINKYPKYWNSIKSNTLKAHNLADELNDGIAKFKHIYPKMKSAKMYFTIGAMRTNGTTMDSLVLIGSELAMADNKTDISEFEEETKEWLNTYFGTNPIEGLILLNVHEFVHTQQQPIPNNLLHQVLYEGVAEFVSVKAMNQPSNVPAIEFGKNNNKVKETFQNEMFYERTYDWMWSSSPNMFNVRDLGYYIGYAIAEKYYDQSENKQNAIAQLIELDYNEPEEIDKFIDDTHFFTKSIETLRKADKKNRPQVLRIQEFGNNAKGVDPNIKRITFEFSEQLNGYNTGLDYSELGENAFPEVLSREWSTDSTSWSLEVALEPSSHYEFWVTSNFKTENNIPLLPELIKFNTRE